MAKYVVGYLGPEQCVYGNDRPEGTTGYVDPFPTLADATAFIGKWMDIPPIVKKCVIFKLVRVHPPKRKRKRN